MNELLAKLKAVAGLGGLRAESIVSKMRASEIKAVLDVVQSVVLQSLVSVYTQVYGFRSVWDNVRVKTFKTCNKALGGMTPPKDIIALNGELTRTEAERFMRRSRAGFFRWRTSRHGQIQPLAGGRYTREQLLAGRRREEAAKGGHAL